MGNLRAALCYTLFALLYFRHPLSFVFLLAWPLLMKHAIAVYQSKDPLLLRPMLGQMSLLALLTNILFSFGLLIA